MSRSKTIAILGAGPAGLEAALYARALGHKPVVYERGAVGQNIRRWGFIRLFSPWKLNVSRLGLEALAEAGRPPPDPAAFPTGQEFVEQYLLPIARSLAEVVQVEVEVLGVAKVGLLKGENIGGKLRGRTPFRLLLKRQGQEEEAMADEVIDATGVYGNPSSLGDGGIPAIGEGAARDAVDYHLVNVRAGERERFAGKTILLVGAGFSAATMLEELLHLQGEAPGTEVIWARRSGGPDPFPTYQGDPLPERARLARAGNRIAAEPPPGCTVLTGVAVRAILRQPGASRFDVELTPVDGGGMRQTLTVDRIIANVGYRPANELFRELQVHQCYASEGPMSLAAALLGSSHGGDCLAQVSFGPESLKHPEPGFFIVGHKSYGRRSDYLLRFGLEQVRDIFRILEEDMSLNLHEPA